MRPLAGHLQLQQELAVLKDQPVGQLAIPELAKMSADLSQSEGRTQPDPTNPHQSSHSACLPPLPAAVPDAGAGAVAELDEVDTMCIQVLEDSPDGGVFVVRIHCRDPFLLSFWLRKAFFYNGQVQQTDTRLREEGDGLEFVLHALHRSQRLSNAHYWTPFLVALCLDALLFRYRLPPHLHWNGNIEEVMKENMLVLSR
ncbi:hypothetical protein AGOR_G00041220 [Albula goreensis]|uniref:Uncharacterized protein n=1 Tax=Albula goreensis TaxID=1534307 RepID=A0A8T3DXN3_9TELE|nr:hypothetical protein AGOR_G00041220 [Albula goreensis]